MSFVLLAGTAVLLGLALWHDALSGWRPVSSRTVADRLVPIIDRERDLASLLSVPFRLWATLRLVVAGGALWMAVATGIPVILALGTLVGLHALPWAVAGLVAARRSAMTRQLAATLLSVGERVERGGVPFDVALRDKARNPDPELRSLLRPLVTADSVDEALVESIAETRFSVAQRAYVILTACRTRSTEALVRTLRNGEVPHLKREAERLDEMRSIRAYHRATVAVLAVLIAAALWWTDQQPAINAFHRTLLGQVLLVVAVAVFALSAAGMTRLSQLRDPLEWDVHVARDLFRKVRRG